MYAVSAIIKWKPKRDSLNGFADLYHGHSSHLHSESRCNPAHMFHICFFLIMIDVYLFLIMA